MESGVTEGKPAVKPKTIAEVFDEAFPQYLAMGMTYNQFWEQDCLLVVPYRKAFKIRQEEINNIAWINGLYIWKAIQSAPLYVNGFIPKGSKIEPYPNKPIDFSESKKTEQERVDDKVRVESEKIKRGMIAFMAAQKAEKKKKELENILKTNPPKKE